MPHTRWWGKGAAGKAVLHLICALYLYLVHFACTLYALHVLSLYMFIEREWKMERGGREGGSDREKWG